MIVFAFLYGLLLFGLIAAPFVAGILWAITFITNSVIFSWSFVAIVSAVIGGVGGIYSVVLYSEH